MLFQSGSSRATMPTRSTEVGAHNHAPTRDFAVEELESALRKAQQLKIAVSCPNGMKIEVDGEAAKAAAVMKLAATACTADAEQLAKKD